MVRKNQVKSLKNELSQSWLKRIRSHFIIGLFITILVVSILIYSTFLKISMQTIFYSVIFLIIFFCGIIYILYGLQMFIPLLTITEKGVIFRRSGFIAFLKREFITFEEISDVKIEKEEHRTYSKPVVNILTKNQKVYKIDMKWIVNIDEIKSKIMNKLE